MSLASQSNPAANGLNPQGLVQQRLATRLPAAQHPALALAAARAVAAAPARRMRVWPLAVAFALAAMTAVAAPARGDTITVGNTYSGNFSMLINGVASTEGGGSVGGSYGVINGVTTPFAFLYCVDIFTNAVLGSTYTATYNNTATINSKTVVNAGQVAWLMLNLAPQLTTQAQYQAMQGLVWTLENPGVVAWDYTNNSATATSYYTQYSSLLGSNTASVARLSWINPVNAQGAYSYQGFVAETWIQIAEPHSLALFATFSLMLLGLTRIPARRGAAVRGQARGDRAAPAAPLPHRG